MPVQEQPKEPESPSAQFGTTMRIAIDPEMLEAARISARKPAVQPPKARRPIAESPQIGGADFQVLLQNIYDGVLITEPSGRIIMSNIRANQFFSAEPGQLPGRQVLDFISGSTESLLPTVIDTLKNNRFVLIQAFCTRLDGSFFAAEISINRLRLGGIDHLSFFVRDVTLRMQQEDQIRAGYNALQNSSSGIVITNRDATVEYCNPAFLALFGIAAAEDIDGHSLREFLCDPARADDVSATIARGETWSGELEMRRVDGTPFYGQTSVRKNENSDGDTIGMVFSFLDITPQKRAQQQLEAYAVELGRKNAQMSEDLVMAKELHQALLPQNYMQFPENAPADKASLRLRHLYYPSGTIGGDFYDIRELSEHEVGILVADVMGHGVRSALVVATIRGLIEQLRPLALKPGEFLTDLNAHYTAIFAQSHRDVTFATAFYGVFDARTGLLRWANAGHPAPYLIRAGGEGATRLRPNAPGQVAALGIFPESGYHANESALSPADLVLIYTDGLAEAQSQEGEIYETTRLARAIQSYGGSGPDRLVQGLLSDACAFSGSVTFEDDVCLLALQVIRLMP